MGHVLSYLVETSNSDGTIIGAVVGAVFCGVLLAIPFIILGVVIVVHYCEFYEVNINR